MTEPLTRIINALEESDKLHREARARRILWVSEHKASFPVISGRPETLKLLSEAEDTLIDGHFVATLLLAMAFIEHTIIDELQLLDPVKGSPRFGEALKLADKQKVFPPDWIKRANTLSVRRNSYVHLKETENQHTLGNRVMNESLHPNALMEADAKDAFDLMYNFFVATLREVNLDQHITPRST
ncbi:hypothetical protein [Azonexus sp. IMCC34839]|uniref:hypothetical protein n=1 Tax=Azonexus sp. IMCC34839 TaxID=3133695 RepID=UPI00399AA9EA